MSLDRAGFFGRMTEEERGSRATLNRNPVAFPRWLAILSALCLFAAGCAHRVTTVHPPAAPPQQQPLPPAAPGAEAPAPPSGPPSAAERQPSVPGEYVEEGVASWYGYPFDGHRTSDGEIYDMRGFTAAHRTLPFGAIVRVTNLRNGLETEVRINDRGPFVANRIIDLSRTAAEAIGMIGPGTAPVRIEMLSGPDPRIGFFGVQVGAFQLQDNAERLRDRLAAEYAPVTIGLYDAPEGRYYRVRVGRVASEGEARQIAVELHANDQLATFVVRLDD